MGNLPTTTGNLSAANARISQLEHEVVELPKAKAEPGVTQKWILEETVIVARIEGELSKIK